MNIESKGFKLEMDSGELWDLASCVKSALHTSMKDHWVNHPDSWRENEKPRLFMLKTMYSHMGRLDMYEDAIRKSEQILEDHEKNKNPKSK